MKNKKIILNVDKILNKDFDVLPSGYDPNQVDELLDFVIEDYKNFDKEIDDIQDRIAEIEQKNKKLENELSSTLGLLESYKTKIEEYERDGYHYAHFENRIRSIEKKVGTNNNTETQQIENKDS
jgi:DivIVA domain-containing protein